MSIPAAFLCIRPKVMSTTWFNALARSCNLTNLDGTPLTKVHYAPSPNATHNASARWLASNGTVERLLRNRLVPRVTVVRNPYDRLVSSYLMIDNLPNQAGWDKWFFWRLSPGGYRRGDGFREFVKKVLSTDQTTYGLNLHVRPQRQNVLATRKRCLGLGAEVRGGRCVAQAAAGLARPR